MRARAVFLVPLLAVVLLLLTPTASAAAAGDDSFLPAPPPCMVQWADPPLYDRYPIWHYVYGSRSGGYDADSGMLDTTNLLQVVKAWLVKLGIRSMEYALCFDPVTPLVQGAGKQMKAMADGLWRNNGSPLVVAALAFAGALALLLTLFSPPGRRAPRFLLTVTLVLLGSYTLFEVAPSMLADGAGIARALGRDLTGAVARAAGPVGTDGLAEERLIKATGEAVWQALVMEPWLDGELSAAAKTKAAYSDGGIDGGRWLEMTPTERASRYRLLSLTTQQTDFVQWDRTADFLPRRTIQTLASLLAALVFTGALLTITAGILFYQVALLAILALAPVWLIVALWMPSGWNIARNVIVKALGALVAQVVLMVVLAVLMVLAQALANLAGALGWFAQGALLALVAVVFARYRFAWLHWRRDSRRVELVDLPAPAAHREEDGRRHSVTASAREALRAGQAPVPGPLPQLREQPAAAVAPRPAQTAGVAAAAVQRPGEPAAVAQLRLEMSRFRDGRHAGEGEMAALMTGHRARSGSQVKAAPAEPVDVSAVAPPTPSRPRPSQGQAVDSFKRASR